MRSCHKFLLILIVSCLASTSCVTHKKLTYLQYKGEKDFFRAVTPETYKIQPHDNLFIRVVTPDPKWSDMFNTMPATSSTYGINEQTADMLSYAVDDEGAIRLPYAGKFIVAGKTLDSIKTELENALKPYVTDAVVTVKMVNNYVSVIGEVQRPGRYPIYKDRLNIFQALAMAGDISEYGNKKKILLIRETSNGSMIKEFSLRDRSIMTSELYYVVPNDVIYAQPMKGKFFQMNAFPYSVILSVATTFLLFWNILK